jgi:hypothetical protein
MKTRLRIIDLNGEELLNVEAKIINIVGWLDDEHLLIETNQHPITKESINRPNGVLASFNIVTQEFKIIRNSIGLSVLPKLTLDKRYIYYSRHVLGNKGESIFVQPLNKAIEIPITTPIKIKTPYGWSTDRSPSWHQSAE